MTDGYVVDTGVFLRWFVDQDGYEHAREIQRAYLAGGLRLETVDFARVEVAEVLRKKGLRGGRLDRAMFLAATRVIDDLGVVVHACDVDRIQRAASLAADYSLRMFDALFVQAALERQLPLLTTDVKLTRAVNALVPVEVLRGISVDPSRL
ncbi:type II toxin-antitoxin system VapC family toxin [Acrocarpospora catenulata]|uniref:type II toxin-antitoxin system VapC family toxin n=1 Tax=Acrocarpospora catenulata TaxID=2836182 RepID=UPI001BDA1089|nr:type II toxin-antitoxin system VapC family toxin [Acrocarpospora catenulata]